MEKERLRAELIRRRNQMDVSDTLQKSASITQNLIESGVLDEAKIVMSYLSFGNEVKTDEIHQYLFRHNKTVFVPYTDEKFVIHPCIFTRETALIPDRLGVPTPSELIFAQGKPDLVLLPCVGVDNKGNRIGFGKGCYDRFLSGKSVLKIALAYQFQVLGEFSSDIYDIPVDAIVTENGVQNTKVK